MSQSRSTTAESFANLPDYIREDLLEWFNITAPTAADLDRLAELYESGRFHAWNCPTCGKRVQSADLDDDEWHHFQGVRQPDYSYFGDRDIFTEETIQRQCDTCRCYAPVTRVTYPEEY